MSERQFEISSETEGSCGRNGSDDLVSSELHLFEKPCEWLIDPSEVLCIAKSSSPSTDLWGTPLETAGKEPKADLATLNEV